MEMNKPSKGAMKASLKLAENYIENMTADEEILVANIIDEASGLLQLIESCKSVVDTYGGIAEITRLKESLEQVNGVQ